MRLAVLLVAATAGCGPPSAESVPPGSFAFGVFGDGPYYPWEQGRFRRVLDDVSRADVQWLLHVGDLLWYPCSAAAFEARLRQLNAVPLPVVYTPGDNEWTDCHEERPGRYEPLDRLAILRRTFFSEPGRSLGARAMPLTSQAVDSTFADFPENARWTYGGFVFSTIHLVGSSNGQEDFPGRTAAHDAEVARRTEAALAWLDGAFATAREDSAKGVVLAVHANVGMDPEREPRAGYDRFVERLGQHAAAFPGPVLFIHGDSHTMQVDQPLRDAQGRPYPNFTRLETFGSPDIGWVRVVVDTVAGQIAAYEPRLMRGWW